MRPTYIDTIPHCPTCNQKFHITVNGCWVCHCNVWVKTNEHDDEFEIHPFYKPDALRFNIPGRSYVVTGYENCCDYMNDFLDETEKRFRQKWRDALGAPQTDAIFAFFRQEQIAFTFRVIQEILHEEGTVVDHSDPVVSRAINALARLTVLHSEPRSEETT